MPDCVSVDSLVSDRYVGDQTSKSQLESTKLHIWLLHLIWIVPAFNEHKHLESTWFSAHRQALFEAFSQESFVCRCFETAFTEDDKN